MQASVDRQPRPRAAQVGEQASSDLQVDVSLNKNGSQENEILRKGTRQLKEQASSYGYFCNGYFCDRYLEGEGPPSSNGKCSKWKKIYRLKQGWGAGCFWILGAGARAAPKKNRSRSRSRKK